MRFKSALLFLGLALLSPTIRAQVPHTVPSGSTDHWTAKSGTALSEDCLTTEGSPQHAECIAYIIGQVDMIGNLEGSLSDGELVNLWKVRPICIPNDTTPTHVADVVIKFIKEHPKRSAESSSAIIIRALAIEWGCPFASK
jgi:hypothetical protein